MYRLFNNYAIKKRKIKDVLPISKEEEEEEENLLNLSRVIRSVTRRKVRDARKEREDVSPALQWKKRKKKKHETRYKQKRSRHPMRLS